MLPTTNKHFHQAFCFTSKNKNIISILSISLHLKIVALKKLLNQNLLMLYKIQKKGKLIPEIY